VNEEREAMNEYYESQLEDILGDGVALIERCRSLIATQIAQDNSLLGTIIVDIDEWAGRAETVVEQ